ncbi:MAG: hypothetical protein KAF91_31180 [Nostoc sp. TH1S01]|nr:hypothetical protein [Nostoc sp. TH1S01]
MSSENLETTNNTWQPDPAWDYYTLWHELIHAKAKIDQVLNRMKEIEDATDNTDDEIREILEPSREILNKINELLTN